MKRIICSLFVVVLLMSLGLTACAKPATEEEAWPTHLTLQAPGGKGGASYQLMVPLAKMIQDHLGISTAVTGGTGTENALALGSNDAQITAVGAYLDEQWYLGKGDLEPYGPQPIRVLLQGWPLEWELLTLKDSGIETWGDLKGKTVLSWPKAAETGKVLTLTTLRAYGLEESDVNLVPFDRPPEGFTALKAGACDAFVAPGIYPSASTMELAATHPLRICNIDDAHMAKIVEELPWVKPLTLPGGTYEGIDQDVQVSSYLFFTVCRKDLPDSLIYAINKMFWENIDEAAGYHPTFKKFRAEDVIYVNFMPYHPGSIEYFQEIGVWTKELDERQARLLELVPAELR